MANASTVGHCGDDPALTHGMANRAQALCKWAQSKIAECHGKEADVAIPQTGVREIGSLPQGLCRRH